MNLPLAINYELQPKKQQTFAINWVNVINLKPNHQPKFISCHQQSGTFDTPELRTDQPENTDYTKWSSSVKHVHSKVFSVF